MAFLIALFAMTYVREEADVPWFHETWRVGHGAWAVSAQSVLAPDLRRMAEHLVDSDIFGNLSPIFSPQIARGIRESCHYQVPLNRLVELPVDATNPAATRQFYLNERLSALLVRLGHVSNSLEQLRAQFDALAAGAQPIIKEALEDIAIEIARLAANPPILPRDLTPSPRHPLEEVFSVHRRQLTTEIPRATKPLFDFFPIPIPLYFQDIAATTLQSGLQDLRRFAITALAARIGEHVRDTAITNHYGWLKPSLNPERTWALIAAAFGSDGPTSATRSFIHVPELLQRDFLEEVSGITCTCGGLFLLILSLIAIAWYELSVLRCAAVSPTATYPADPFDRSGVLIELAHAFADGLRAAAKVGSLHVFDVTSRAAALRSRIAAKTGVIRALVGVLILGGLLVTLFNLQNAVQTLGKNRLPHLRQ
jgi:hypothetical protein